MSDPQDLLYTNKFISEDVLTYKDLNTEGNYYNRFEDYISNTQTELSKYLNDEQYETSAINLDRNLDQKWPINKNKNHYPLFDSYIKDISTDKYQKEIITKVNIDNRNRNYGKYPNPNSFTLNFDTKFTNIKKFVLSDINFRNINQPVTNSNNNLAWQYASTDNLQSNSYDNTIIPVPIIGVNTISYSSLPNSTFSYTTSNGNGYSDSIDNYLVYQTNINPGFYSVAELIETIKYYTSKIIHGGNLTTDIKIVEQPYLVYQKKIGTPHLFSIYINPISNVVRFVNRMEELKIAAIQTFSPYDINIIEDDIFYNFSSNYINNGSYTLDTSFIYITLSTTSDISYQYYYNLYCIYSPNAFPLVITNLEYYIGNINNELINYTEFYDLNIYLKNGYSETDLKSISYYKFIDTITFNTSTTVNGVTTNFNQVYLRFALKLSTGNINGINYDQNGYNIKPSITNNILFSSNINNFLKNYGNIISPQSIINGASSQNNYNTSCILTDYVYYEKTPLIGRALLFRWIFDKLNNNYITYQYQTINQKKRSILSILAWAIQDESYQIYTAETNGGFKFVQSNIQNNILSGSNLKLSDYLQLNHYPILNLNLQRYNDQYYFSSNSYLFIKISFNSTTNGESSNRNEIRNAIDDNILQYNQIYVYNSDLNVGIGEDYTNIKSCYDLNLLKRDSSSIFAKIILSDIPDNYNNNILNIQNNNSYSYNYDKEIDNVDEISISIYNPSMELISLNNNFSFTLTIHELKDVLKETLINTKTNNVTVTGNIR
jgi:hypothetical protein